MMFSDDFCFNLIVGAIFELLGILVPLGIPDMVTEFVLLFPEKGGVFFFWIAAHELFGDEQFQWTCGFPTLE